MYNSCSCSNMHSICSKLIASQREDIFKNLREYIKHDKELKIFTNIAIDAYKDAIQTCQHETFAKVEEDMNNLIDNKIRTLIDQTPLNLVTESVYKKYNSSISYLNVLSITGITISVINIGLYYYSNYKK